MKFASAIQQSKKYYNEFLNNNNITQSMFLLPANYEEISDIILLPKPKKSSGHDKFSSLFLKDVNLAICKPLSMLINKSMETGIDR